MIKPFLASLLLLFSGLALAGGSCADIQGKQIHAPLNISNGIVCFMRQYSLDEHGTVDNAWIALYFISNKTSSIGIEKDGIKIDLGEIVDVFTLDIDRDRNDEIVMIHREIPRNPEPNTSGEFYSVFVFNQRDNVLTLNKRASEWFGYTYSWYANGNNKVYEFPYLTRQTIKNALSSPFISLMMRDEVIPVIVKRKSYFYESPMVYGKPTKYLIAGDKATVDKYTAGWCQVNYTGGKKPLQMWMMCGALEPDTGK
jgi:hypothetical protein